MIEYKTGKSLRLSKAELLNFKKNIQDYSKAKFPELSHTPVSHGMDDHSKISDKEYQLKLRTGRKTDKEEIVTILHDCYKNANSKQKFFNLLKKYNIKTYERSGRLTGIIFNNNKFRFNRLGFDEERLKELDIANSRIEKISEIRR